MSDKCKDKFSNGKPCNRKAVDRGWCNLHSIPAPILLWDDVDDATDGITCPCPWGHVASPAHSGDKTTSGLSCTNCNTRTPYMQLTKPEHIKPLADAWKAACEAKRISLQEAAQ